MRKSALFRIIGIIVAVLALGLLPCPAWAQRGGGHGGGGGFHGGGMGGGFHGGGAGFHGGGSFLGAHSGYRGGRYYGAYRGGFRGGANGWRAGWGRPVGWGWPGRYWGYPRYGWGWGLGFGWPWWGWGWGYPSAYYGYPWYGAYPYDDNYDPSYSCPPGYSCPDNGNGDPPSPNSGTNSRNSPARPSRAPAYGGAICTTCGSDDPVPTDPVASRSNAPILSVDHLTATPSSYRVARATSQQNSSLTPDVRNAMRHLREMPPFARQREIETGRYSHFSPQKKELLRQFDQQLNSGWAD